MEFSIILCSNILGRGGSPKGFRRGDEEEGDVVRPT